MIRLQITENFEQSLVQELNNLQICKGNSKVTYDVIVEYEKVLKKFRPGVIIAADWGSGNCYFRKLSNNRYEKLISPFYDLNECDAYNVAEWLAGRGNWCKKPLWLSTEAEFDSIASSNQKRYGSTNGHWNFWDK